MKKKKRQKKEEENGKKSTNDMQSSNTLDFIVRTAYQLRSCHGLMNYHRN